MANFPAYRHDATGKTLYVVLHNAAGQYWDTTGTPAYETFVPADWANYDIAATETPADSYQYIAAVPAVTTDALVYVTYYERAGAAVAIEDLPIAHAVYWWDGTAITDQGADVVAVDGDADAAGNLESACDNYSVTRGLTGTALPAVVAGAASGVPLKDASNFLSVANMPAVAAGGAGGLFIAGTNAATTITTGLTTHFIGTVDTVTTYTGNTKQTGDSFARLGAAGVSLTNLGGMSTTMKAQVNTAADAAIVSYNLDHLMLTPVTDQDDMTEWVANLTVLSNIMTKAGDTSTYIRSTDSLEGLQSTTVGAGAVPWPYTVYEDDGSTPIGNAAVWVTSDAAGTNVVAGTNYTHATLGTTTFYLDAGTYYFWVQAPGHTFTLPDTEVVA